MVPMGALPINDPKKKDSLAQVASVHLADHCSSLCDSPKRRSKYARVLNMLSASKIESQAGIKKKKKKNKISIALSMTRQEYQKEKKKKKTPLLC